MKFNNYQFILFSCILIILLLLFRSIIFKSNYLPICDNNLFTSLPKTFRYKISLITPYLKIIVLALLLLAFSRPQIVQKEITVQHQAVDLVIALDLSTSMLAENSSNQNRLNIAKDVLINFLNSRSSDRIGFVVFGARAYSAAPLTMDHIWLKNIIYRLNVGVVEDGTAIGDGLLTALDRLRNKTSKNCAVIILTDGRNNVGTSPNQAAEAAAAIGIKVYTVGIGANGKSLFPTENPLGGVSYRFIQADLDEDLLRTIAKITGGSYFRADDKDGLQKAFFEINRLEKRPINQKIFFSYTELYQVFLISALILTVISQILNLTLLRRAL